MRFATFIHTYLWGFQFSLLSMITPRNFVSLAFMIHFPSISTYHGFAMREVSEASVVCSVTAAIVIDFCLKKLNVFSQHIGKNNWISEFHRTNTQELKCWSIFCVNYFLRYYLMMQHQPIVKRVNGMHEWGLFSFYQLLITAVCTSTGGNTKGSHSRSADRCPFVLKHS